MCRLHPTVQVKNFQFMTISLNLSYLIDLNEKILFYLKSLKIFELKLHLVKKIESNQTTIVLVS
jgi:hypothetical protein